MKRQLGTEYFPIGTSFKISFSFSDVLTAALVEAFSLYGLDNQSAPISSAIMRVLLGGLIVNKKRQCNT